MSSPPTPSSAGRADSGVVDEVLFHQRPRLLGPVGGQSDKRVAPLPADESDAAEVDVGLLEPVGYLRYELRG